MSTEGPGDVVNVMPGNSAQAIAEAQPVPRSAGEALRMHGTWLRAVAVARLRSYEGADDVMQEVAAAAVRNWTTLESMERAKPWLYRLTVRAALMHRRTLGRARRRVQEAAELARAREGTMPGAFRADPLDALLASERVGYLREAMARLPARDVELLLMKHVDDCSYKDIAARLGVTTAVVEMRLFRTRQKLRRLMEESYG
jgi:RNA polymerase sigma-70 factor (ECF subfamily)